MHNVQGIPVAVPVKATLSIRRTETSVSLAVRLIADLGDLQAKAGSIVDTFPLPTDRCGHKGLDNVVVRIWGKEIIVEGNTATLKLHGDVEVWACVDVPFFGTQQQPLGQQPFDAFFPFRFVRRDARTVGLELGDPRIDLGGGLGPVTQGILDLFKIDLGSRAKDALSQAILPGLLQAQLPEAVAGIGLAFQGATFASEGGHLVAQVDVGATAAGDILSRILQTLTAFSGGSR
jgi:hypothetical protein